MKNAVDLIRELSVKNVGNGQIATKILFGCQVKGCTNTCEGEAQGTCLIIVCDECKPTYQERGQSWLQDNNFTGTCVSKPAQACKILTEIETECMEHLRLAWDKFCELPCEGYPKHNESFQNAMNQLQDIILSRPTLRAMREDKQDAT